MLKLRKAFFTSFGSNIAEWEGSDLTSDEGLSVLLPYCPDYNFELFQPLILITATSKSETIKAIAAEALQ
jgi:hypothetical protein